MTDDHPPRALRTLLSGQPVQPLGPGSPVADKKAALLALSLDSAFSPAIASFANSC